MIKTEGIKFAYAIGKGFEFPDLECDSSKTCLILGESGVGKTTLLHLLGGLMKPKDGKIIIGDTNITKLSDRELDKFRGRNIGIVFQRPHFIASLNVLENLLLGKQLAGIRPKKDEVLELLENLGIKHRAHAKPQSLSQGELQRASVARAILNKPKVILADEPTSALDDISCHQVINLLEKTAESLGAALLVVTHDSRLKSLMDHQIILK